MGRLQALIAASCASAALCACDESRKPNPAPPSNRRSEVIAASGTQPPARTSVSAPVRTAPSKPRALCQGPSLNRPMPSEKVGHAEAPGAPSLGDQIAVGDGKWTWINLWAAWCVPCKEEMPRLQQWQGKLGSAMRLTFLSLDDDERQLMRFLEAQPSTGVRTSHWLPEGSTREGWLSALKLKSSPQLPVQILVNPTGRVHCIIEGAVEDSDFLQVSTILSAR
jgi:thiol-disulfide isomerase/thioredoxin